MTFARMGLAVFCVLGCALWGADSNAPELRLPSTIQPKKGRLELTIAPAQETFSGTATYELKITEATETVWVNATDLKIRHADLSQQGETIPLQIITGNQDVVGFRAPKPITAGLAQLSIQWDGTLDSTLSRGLYRVKEGERWYAYSFFEPIDARRAFPCFDEPGFKIPWTLILHIPQGEVGLANSPATQETDEPGGTRRIEFAESKPMPSYLVALVVGPFDVLPAGTAGHHGTPLRFVVPKGRGAETRYAVEATPKLVSLLEDFFGTPYPFEKLDVAVVPRYWGTMEHPGLVALGQPLTLIKPQEETPERKQAYANIAVHELGHYWFGDVVTMAWWDDTWLNEGMTTWLDLKMTDAFEPAWRIPTERLLLVAQAMRDDSLPSAKRVRQPVLSKDNIENSFDNSLTYFKGNGLMSMVEQWLGPDRFRGIVRGYIQKHQWGNATSEDWLQAVEADAGVQAKDVFRTFITQPGIPVIAGRCLQTPTGWSVELTQKRFLASGSEQGTPQEWVVPVGIRTGLNGQAGSTFYAVLSGKSGVFPIPGGQRPDWLLLNAGGTGYYRVAYDPAQLGALTNTAGSTLTSMEKVQLLEDAKALGDTGALDIPSTMALASHTAGDPDRLVVTESLGLASRIPVRLMSPADKARMARFVQASWGRRAASLGWTPRAGDTTETLRLRKLLVPFVAEQGTNKALAREARALAAGWLKNRRGVDPDLVPAVLSLAARTSGKALFKQLLAEAGRTKDVQERGEILSSLGSFRSPELLKTALGQMLTGPFDFRESRYILYAALSDQTTKPLAWSWLKAHFADVAPKFRSDEMCGLITHLGGSLWGTVSREDLAGFFQPRVQSIDAAPIALARALETFDVRLARAQRDLAPSIQFLKASERSSHP
jgi:aminopeptidase N